MQSSSMDRSLELLDSILDLHLSDDGMDHWLGRFAKMTGSAAAYCINWRLRTPANATLNSSDSLQLSSSHILEKLELLDSIITTSASEDTGILNELFQIPNDLLNPNLMLGFIRSDPVCTLLILRCDDDDRPEGWTETDHGYFRGFLPILLKAHLLHKKITNTQTHLDIADKVLNSSPRGIIAITPAGKIIQANYLAHDIIASDSSFTEEDGRLIITSPTIAAELDAKLLEIQSAPSSSLKDFIWNRSFLNTEDNRTFQIAIHAYAIDNWRLASGGDDRFLVIFINELGAESKPTPEELQDFYNLTTAQARLVAALLDGHNIKAAAEKLNLSIHTVRSHLRSIYKRLGVENNADLLRRISSTLVNYQSKDSV